MFASALKNDVFLRSLLREPVPYTPIWLMRQAGRYLPEYNETRARAGSFMGLAQNPDYAAEVTLQPLARFDLDAAILFSDILTVPHAMGLGLDFAAGEGPRFAHPVRTEDDVRRLAVPDMDKLRYVFDAVRVIRRELDGKVPLIGFAGSPWTIACYMVEGQGSDDYRLIKTMLYARPDLLHHILEINAQATLQYLNAQIDAGAQAVMLFDSWGGVLADGLFQQFSLAYTRKVVAGLKRENEGRRVPVIVFTKGGGQWLEQIAACGCDAVGLTGPWTWRRRVAAPATRLRSRATWIPWRCSAAATPSGPRRAGCWTRSARSAKGHVFNLGHGISRFTPPEAVAELVDEVHRHSRSLRG